MGEPETRRSTGRPTPGAGVPPGEAIVSTARVNGPDEQPAETQDMPLALVGCDFRVASAAWRGALVLGPEDRKALHERLGHAAQARGLAVLDTCNRTEWLVEAPDPTWAADLLRAWMLRRWRESFPREALPAPYVHVGAAAARHFIRVAVGLESFVPGEREIAGQCHRALVDARDRRRASLLLNELGNAVGRTVRRLQRACGVQGAGRGVPKLAAEEVCRLAQALPESARVAVAGMGEVGRKVTGLLEARLGRSPICLNRTIPPERAERWRPLSELPALLPHLDALVVATSAPTPVLTPTHELLGDRVRPLVVFDLGIPAQVRAPTTELPELRLLGVDELCEQGRPGLEPEAIALADEIVDLGVEDFLRAFRVGRQARVLRAAQESRRRTADEELPALLDRHAPALPASARRRLETDLRQLMSQQHRALLEAFDDLAGLSGAAEDE